VAHDSHNLICVGTSDEEMLKAMRLLIGARGGIAITYGTESLTLPLPIAGLMTDADGTEVARLYVTMNEAVRKLGSPLRAPFMTLSFMALLVIPELKMSDRGLFDGNEFSFTKLFERQ
jgi:adenine deaminase